jgi:hypothetical protein
MMYLSRFMKANPQMLASLLNKLLRIPRSHIEIECVFNHTNVLTILKCCRLQVDNLDRIINVLKN